MLVSPKNPSHSNGETVKVEILQGNEAKIRVKTTDGKYRPGYVYDNDKDMLWFGGTLQNDSKEERVRRQKTYKVEEKTIISDTWDRVEWKG